MKRNWKIIEYLNLGFVEELSVINQGMVQDEMCFDLRQEKPLKQIERRAFAEMKQAEKHIARSKLEEETGAHRHLIETLFGRAKGKQIGIENYLLKQE